MAFVVVLLSKDLTAGVVPGYWPSALGAASFALPFVAPACATAAAWEGARCTRGAVPHWAPIRSGLGVALPLLVPVFALGAVGMAAALALTVAEGHPSGGTPPVGVIAVWLVVLAAHSCAGFLLGRRLPLVVGAPLALLLSFVLTAYPAAMEPLWLRHMVDGGLADCCSLDQTPNWRAASSAVVLALGVIVAAVVLLTVLARRVRIALTGAAVVVGLVGSGWLAYGVPVVSVGARSAEELQCAGEKPRICLWPEAENASMVREDAADALHRLQRAGLVVPDELTMDSNNPRRGAAFMGLSTNPSGVRSGVGAALLPTNSPTCTGSRQSADGDAFGPTIAWLSLTAGADPQDIAARYEPGSVAVAVRVQQAARDRQLAWFQQNRRALSDCATHPAPVPAPDAREAAR
ncbi:hypothetical protein ACIQU6_28180 [Streptomyces sp. NPDC090442]|uniref:DUF7224 domain-containing protein n=1 Tax=Streptomyces sp. NPDC090442 TaxID=3365962 RepID=UPI0037FDEA27